MLFGISSDCKMSWSKVKTKRVPIPLFFLPLSPVWLFFCKSSSHHCPHQMREAICRTALKLKHQAPRGSVNITIYSKAILIRERWFWPPGQSFSAYQVSLFGGMAYLENCTNIPPEKQWRQLFEKQKLTWIIWVSGQELQLLDVIFHKQYRKNAEHL